VIPLGRGSIQTMIRLTKLADNKFKQEKFGKFRFVPFIKGIRKDGNEN